MWCTYHSSGFGVNCFCSCHGRLSRAAIVQLYYNGLLISSGPGKQVAERISNVRRRPARGHVISKSVESDHLIHLSRHLNKPILTWFSQGSLLIHIPRLSNDLETSTLQKCIKLRQGLHFFNRSTTKCPNQPHNEITFSHNVWSRSVRAI